MTLTKNASFSSRFTLKPMLLAASLGLAAAVGAGGTVFAGDEAGKTADRAEKRADFHQRYAERMAQDLQLDESQKAGVQAIFERNRPAQQKLRERSKAHWEAMKALKPGSPDYSSRAQALADEAGTLARDRVLNRTQLNAELATVLTPGQMEKLQARHHKVRGGHGPGAGGHRWHPRRKGGEDDGAVQPGSLAPKS